MRGRRMTKEGKACEKECVRKGVQVLFMDYLTCLGYNPPKASIRIIASSSSHCYHFSILPLFGRKERDRSMYRLQQHPPHSFDTRKHASIITFSYAWTYIFLPLSVTDLFCLDTKKNCVITRDSLFGKISITYKCFINLLSK